MSMSILYVCTAFSSSVSSSVSVFFFFLFPGTLMKSVVSALSSVTSVFRNISVLAFSAFNNKSSVKVGRNSVASSSVMSSYLFSVGFVVVYILYSVGAYVSIGILFCYVFLPWVVASFTFHLSFFPFLL